MSTTPPKTERKQLGAASRLFLVGAMRCSRSGSCIVLAGGDGGTPEGIGVVFMSLASRPGWSPRWRSSAAAFVSRRSRKGKPFA